MADKDLSAVGNAASAKKGPSQPAVLKSITIDFSDNGGATIREIRERKVPEGRRASSGFPMSSDVKENTFENMGRARAHVIDLMGGEAAEEASEARPRPAMPPPPAPRPPAVAAAGPNAAVAARLPPPPMPTGGPIR